ncbi:hypothetical protein WI873_23590, partial [Salmonella enterica subsp. enterica serovar Corvallis]
SSTTRQSKPISFGICSRFVSASSKLKSVAFPFGYQRPADVVNIKPRLYLCQQPRLYIYQKRFFVVVF